MIKRKQIKQQAALLQKQEKQLYDEDGAAIIKLTVLDDSELLSPYSDDDGLLINSETASFLEHSTKAIPPRQELALHICSDELDARQKVFFEKGIRNYYENSFLALAKDLKRNFWLTMLLTLFGAIYFGVIIGLSFVVTYDMILEMLSIAGWVFLWEAVDLFFLERPKLKAAQLRAYALLNAKIKFEGFKKP